MIVLNYIGVQALFLCLVDAVMLTHRLQSRKNYDAICSKVTNNPFFESLTVIGKPWRVYFTWNMKLDELCIELMFKYTNPLTLSLMKQHLRRLKLRPQWPKEVLCMSMGSKEVILFTDRSGIAGQFIGVPHNTQNGGNRKLPQKSYKFTIKLLHNGQYLLVSDCNTGTTSLSLRQENRPNREEIEALAAKFDFGDAFPACTSEVDTEIATEPLTTATDILSEGHDEIIDSSME